MTRKNRPVALRTTVTILGLMAVLVVGTLWALYARSLAMIAAAPAAPSAVTAINTSPPTPVLTSTTKPSPIPTWTPTPTPQPTGIPATASPTALPDGPSSTPSPTPLKWFFYGRWIDIDLSHQTLTAYQGDQVARTTLVSTGKEKTPTPTGLFHIHTKLRYDDMRGPGYYLRNVPYVMYFYQGYGLHGTYWHTNFGQTASHGCVNLPTAEAKWLYEWVAIGTPVNIHE